MIYGNIRNIGNIMAYPEPIAKVLKYLVGKDFLSMDTGVYEIEGDDIYAQIQDAKGDIIANKRPEVHKRYIDVQYSPEGGEIIGFATDTGNNEIDEELFEEKDIKFYKKAENEIFIRTNPGDLFVFYPWDVHRPACVEKEPRIIRKVVAKVNIKLLKGE